ncbi:MAG: uracil-DNA glycosylase [Candidatus Kapabacteria bacterium]|nr:uracil-DNA glycosylase [Candidatus Kapabacteria bacterium]
MQINHETAVQYLKQQMQMYGEEMYITIADDVSFTTNDVEMPQSIETTRIESIMTSIDWTTSTALPGLCDAISGCTNCALGHTRNSFVFGSGNPNAHIMVVGEAPGADEDEQGLPFVGRAGQLLTKVLEAINLSRDEVYICNILKCRPPGNRKPLASETDQCEPYLWKQIELVKPRFILALGLTAANTLLKNKESMTNLRGKIHDYQGIKTLVTYHPAALLRNPEWKKLAWEDVKYLRKLYDAS